MSQYNNPNFEECLKRAKEEFDQIEKAPIKIKEKRIEYFVIPTGNKSINLKVDTRSNNEK